MENFVEKLQEPFKEKLKSLLGNMGYKIYILEGNLPLLSSGKIDYQNYGVLKEAFSEKKPIYIRM